VNRTTHRFLLRPLTGLALAAALVGVPMATASSASSAASSVATGSARQITPLENRYCDSESGFDCLSYGYPPDPRAYWTGAGAHQHRSY
jgi:hypothetical protein